MERLRRLVKSVLPPEDKFTGWIDMSNPATPVSIITIKATTSLSVDTYFLNGGAVEHIYVPASAVDTYKTTEIWSAYSSLIEALPT